MPRFFFDVHSAGAIQVDEIGSELEAADEVPDATMKLLPDLARDGTPKSGQHQSFVVMVRDERGRSVFSATLSLTGLWLAK